MTINRAVGAGISIGIACAGVIGIFGGNFGAWLAVGILLGAAGGEGLSEWAERQAPQSHRRDVS